ncbi:MAG: amino acid permease [Methanoregulaceae archaeon]
MILETLVSRMSTMFRTKTIAELMEHCEGESGLRRVIQPWELLLLGIGGIIGTGIFVITGMAAANYSGPALVISFVIAGIACILAALCYAEFAGMVPVAGSAYTYCYASMGEVWAWIIGWDLILEYSVSVSVVGVGWSAYVVHLLSEAGVMLPPAFVNPPGVGEGIVNLPAVGIILVITGVLVLGMKESARLNSLIVLLNVSVIGLFLFLTSGHVSTINWTPFMPFGWIGVFSGAAIVFFAYVGFDSVLAAAEEVENPQKNLPRCIIGSVIIVMILYVAVAAMLTGVIPYYLLRDTGAPVAFALDYIGVSWGAAVLSTGALCGMTSVILVTLYGQTRIFFAMARDGLLPRALGDLHPFSGTPVNVTLLVGCATALAAGFLPLDPIAELVNIGALAAFVIVAAGVLILRRTRPEIRRPFRCPLVPLIPVLCIIVSALLIVVLSPETLFRFLVWLGIGLAIYFAARIRTAEKTVPS